MWKTKQNKTKNTEMNPVGRLLTQAAMHNHSLESGNPSFMLLFNWKDALLR